MSETRVDLVQSMGDDLAVANAARVSFAKESAEFSERDAGLIRYLARNGHWSPLAHTAATFRVAAPVFVARQLVKHTVGLCVSGDTEITFVKLANGISNGVSKVTISDLYKTWSGQGSKYHGGRGGHYQVERRNIRVLNTSTGAFETGRIVDVIHSGRKDVYEITSDSGATLKLTADHRIWTPNGWQPLRQAVGLSVTASGVASMSRAAFIGRNGRQYGGYDTYRIYDWMKECRDAGLSICQISDRAGCSYYTVRKWLKNHGLQFNPLDGLCGVNGNPPWNKGRSGYKLNVEFSEERRAHLSASRSGERSNFWRGGITPDRAMIHAWTTRMARACHEAYGFTCQNCGKVGGGDLHAHHIVPVATDPSLAREFDNLATVCNKCHRKIHASPESELAFIEVMRSRGKLVGEYVPRRRAFNGNPLRVHFEKITNIRRVGIEDVYDLTVDHPGHNFVGNGFVLHNCWNEVSRRYVDAAPEFYLPRELRERPAGSVKQGSGGPHPRSAEWAERIAARHEADAAFYAAMIEDGIAPEQARAELPQATMTEWWWTGNVASFARVCRLRLAPDAQSETREVAAGISEHMGRLFPVSWAALMGEAA